MTETDDPAEDLAHAIRRRIQTRGPLTFAEFMEAALYDRGGGFYSTSPLGENGHFVTSPLVSPAFGVLVARQIEEFWELLDKPDEFWVVEIGAGDGTLAGQILDFLPAAARGAARYVAIERGAAGRDAMQHLDATVLEELRAAPGQLTGCVIANELLDNVPFHRVRGTERGPVELYVGLDGEDLALIEGPVSSPEISSLAPSLVSGQEAVVQPHALALVDQACALLERGYVWLVDYGFTGGARPSVPHGYRAHRLETDLLTDPGSRDITAGVDFDLIAARARGAGHAVWGPVPQRDALLRLGYRQLDEEARTRQLQAASEGRGIEANRIYSARSRATLLVDPQALGGFLVLCLGIGVAVSPSSTREVG